LRVLEYFNPLLPLTDITRTALVDMEEHFRQHGNTDATINRKLSALSKMLHVAYEHGWVSTLPVMHRKKEGRGRIRYFSVEEERAILALCYEWGKADHGDCIQVLLDTGMRPSEVFNLEKRDINFQHNLIHIFENKTDHPRSLPMTKRVRAILLTRTTTRSKPFPYEGRWLDYVWTRVRVTLGMQDDEQFVPYACRHTCATRLLQRGFTLPELQKWLGHKSLTMTMRYAHLSPTALLKGAQLLEQEVPHATPFTGSVDAVLDSSVCSEPVSRVRGAEHPHPSSAELESAIVPGVCATTPSRTL
jgi:integrase